jgi:hypothetical protein
MSLHADRKTAQHGEESRRLWDDQRVWFVNCVAIEAAWAAVPAAERAAARRGCDQMLAALVAAW